MKYLNVLLLAGICMLPAVNVSAQSEKKSAVQVTFIPPLGTHGTGAAQYTNVFSFNILAGISKNETAFTFGSLANIISNNANGLQFAGLYNSVGNEGRGVMFSGLLNTVGNSYSGLQFAGLSNIAKSMKGLQLAGLANVAGDVEGFQLAGLVNVAKNVSGAQFAAFINIAENSDYPIGVINLIKNGEKSISVTYNEIGSTVVTFRSGGKYTYGLIGLGYNFSAKGKALVSTGGLGAHINCTPWLRINNELSCETVGSFSNSEKTTFRAGYALMPAFKTGKHIEIFGGPTLNYLQTDDLNNANMFPANSLWKDWGASKLQQLYVGYQVGVQFVL